MAGIELHVPDFDAVRAFYGELLGFDTVWAQDPDGHKGYLVMQSGKNILRFWCGNDCVHDHPYFRQFPATSPNGKGVELVIETDNLDALYKIFEGTDALLEPLKTKPWGLADFRIKDPFGYYLRITTPHDITATTSFLIP